VDMGLRRIGFLLVVNRVLLLVGRVMAP